MPLTTRNLAQARLPLGLGTEAEARGTPGQPRRKEWIEAAMAVPSGIGTAFPI